MWGVERASLNAFFIGEMTVLYKTIEELINSASFSDSDDLLRYFGQIEVAEHCTKVANEAKRLAKFFGLDEGVASTAGFLHDISNIIPQERYVEVAGEFGICVLNEEKICPVLLHQKLSKVIARDVFAIEDERVLDAIECHTTLKPYASKIDMILFIADKLSWDYTNNAEIVNGIRAGLEVSIEEGAYSYLSYMWNHRSEMRVLHPWVENAYRYYNKMLR